MVARNWCRINRTHALSVLVTALVVAAAAPARGQSAPDAGKAFEPKGLSQPLYGTQAPVAHYTRAADGSRIYIDTHLPAPKEGRVPPERLPTILVMSPYELPRSRNGPYDGFVSYFTARGYVVAIGHVLGTAKSEGCWDLFGPAEIDATARTIEYVGRDAPWADGNVGMAGGSYLAQTQVGAATLGDPRRTRYLKAIIPGAPATSLYDFAAWDGVPFAGFDDALLRVYVSALTHSNKQTVDLANATCEAQVLAEARLGDGDFEPFYAAREYRRGTSRVRAAVLFHQGLLDYVGHVRSPVEFFDRLPDRAPHKMVLGQYDHSNPDGENTGMAPVNRFPREDVRALEHAWFDRWLKGLPTGVEDWPRVQVQHMDGQWREEPGWPATEGPRGHLALGPSGTLGAANPSGSTSYPENSMQIGASRGTQFSTPPLTGPLHLTGEPKLDLWVELDRPAANFAARLYALDASGNLVTQRDVDLDGFRSARHLDPFVDGRFEQTQAKPAPIGRPVKIPIRFRPMDVTIPRGGRLVLGLSGGAAWTVYNALALSTQPTRSGATVKVLHDCEHPSILRFRTPRPDAKLINVREADEPADQPLAANPSPRLDVDGGGLVQERVCGAAPDSQDHPRTRLTGNDAHGRSPRLEVERHPDGRVLARVRGADVRRVEFLAGRRRVAVDYRKPFERRVRAAPRRVRALAYLQNGPRVLLRPQLRR